MRYMHESSVTSMRLRQGVVKFTAKTQAVMPIAVWSPGLY